MNKREELLLKIMTLVSSITIGLCIGQILIHFVL